MSGDVGSSGKAGVLVNLRLTPNMFSLGLSTPEGRVGEGGVGYVCIEDVVYKEGKDAG